MAAVQFALMWLAMISLCRAQAYAGAMLLFWCIHVCARQTGTVLSFSIVYGYVQTQRVRRRLGLGAWFRVRVWQRRSGTAEVPTLPSTSYARLVRQDVASLPATNMGT